MKKKNMNLTNLFVEIKAKRKIWMIDETPVGLRSRYE